MRTVLSLGQCSFDHGQLERAFKGFALVIPVADESAALGYLEQNLVDLVIVNREFDENGASGIEFIKLHSTRLKAQGIPVMLVSNYPDAQKQAVAAGAIAGFGKSQLEQKTIAGVLAQLG